MTAEARSTAEFEGKGSLGLDPEGDLKGSGGIVRCEGEGNDGIAIDGTFVMGNGDSDDPTEGDRDPEEKPDRTGAAIAEPDAEENGTLLVNAGSVTEKAVVGDWEGSEGKRGDGELCLEKGDGRAEGVVLIENSEIEQRTEPDMGEKKVASGELCEKDGYKESSVSDASNGECCEEGRELGKEKGIGESCREEEKRELPLENGHAHLEDVDAEVESAVEVEEKAEHEAVPRETRHQEELASAEQRTELDIGEKKVENGESCEKDGNKESSVSDASNGECCEEGEELSKEKGFGESCWEEERRELSLENGHAHLDDVNAEIESAVEVEEKAEHDAVPREIYHQEEFRSAAEAGEKQKAKVRKTNQQAGVESAIGAEDMQEPRAVATEAEHEEELDSSVKVEEKQDTEAVVVNAKHQEDLESAVEEKPEPKAVVAETRQQPELESSVKVEEEQKSETAVTETDHQRELEPSVEVKGRLLVETAVTETKHQREPETSVEVEGKLEVETAVTEIYDIVEPESVVKVEEEQQSCTKVAEVDGQEESETVELEEKQEARSVVTETNERAEPESVKMEEEQQTLTVRGAHDQEESELVVHVEDKLEIDIVVSAANGHEEFRSAVEVEAKQQPKIDVREIDGQEESKSALEVELEPQPVVAEIEVIEVEQKREPMTVIDEPPDQLRMVPEVKPQTTLETGDGNQSPEFDEAISICHVDVMGSTAQSSGDPLDDVESMPADHVDMQLESEARIDPLESSSSPRLHHVDHKELVNEAAARSGIEAENGLAKRGAGNDTKVEGDVCDIISDSKKDVAVYNVGEMKLGPEVNDSKCMPNSVEGDRSIMHKDDGEEPTCVEVEASDRIRTPPEEPSGSALDGEKLEIHAVKRQQCFLIKIPRFNDDGLKTKLQHARLRLDEKTQSRDSIRVEVQKKKVTLDGYREKLEAARAEERVARAAVSAKRQEIYSVQSMINKMKNASSIDDINDKIRSMEHSLQHESITLPLEKQYIREIKQLKHHREQLSANKVPQAEIQEVFDRRDQIEERFKTLKKELDSLRTDVLRAESNVKAAWKKRDDEFQLLKDLQVQFRVADNLRQEAYGHMQNLRKESFEKGKHFSKYKDDQQTATNYVFAGDREGLQSHCSKQVEKNMELWNNDEEFRKQYVKSNVNSTLRRLRTLDGRSLGPDEEPPILHSNIDRRSINDPLPLPNGSTPVPVLDLEVKEKNPGALAEPKQVALTNPSAKSKNSTTSRGPVKVMVSNNVEAEKEITRTKEEAELVRKAEELARREEELARKEEELRKEQAAAGLKERCRLEQRAKAKEAEERKRQKADKAQAKAEHRAQKESELREKKRAKKEKKKFASADATNGGTKGDSASIVDTAPPETAKDSEIAVTTGRKRSSSRPAATVKQYNKIQPLPLPLRSRGKRKMQAWMWVLLTALLVLLLFLAGNYVSVSHHSLPYFGF